MAKYWNLRTYIFGTMFGPFGVGQLPCTLFIDDKNFVLRIPIFSSLLFGNSAPADRFASNSASIPFNQSKIKIKNINITKKTYLEFLGAGPFSNMVPHLTLDDSNHLPFFSNLIIVGLSKTNFPINYGGTTYGLLPLVNFLQKIKTLLFFDSVSDCENIKTDITSELKHQPNYISVMSFLEGEQEFNDITSVYNK